ncbi:MAG: acyl-ACP--UDP-N-acetylglucosamine O-acyltransferase [Candidatus Xenobiia bacterium LiM19]
MKGEITTKKIHHLAIIKDGAVIEDDVEIGPYSLIGENVTIGSGTVVGSHVFLDGWTTVGKNCQLFHGAVIGTPPQDVKYKGQRSFVQIGDNNIIREFVTIHRASQKDAVTQIGSNNFLMAYVHIGHNCEIGSYNTIANAVSLAGHVEVEDKAVIGGMTGFHQFVRVGSMAMVGGYARVVKDVPPYSLVAGQPARLFGINTIGLKRQNIGARVRGELKRAYKIIGQMNRLQALEEIRTNINPSDELEHLIKFLENPSKMGIILRFGDEQDLHSNLNLNLDFFK